MCLCVYACLRSALLLHHDSFFSLSLCVALHPALLFVCLFIPVYPAVYDQTVPTAAILGEPDLHVDKGSTINLTCSVKYSPEPPAYIFWYHHDEVSAGRALVQPFGIN